MPVFNSLFEEYPIDHNHVGKTSLAPGFYEVRATGKLIRRKSTPNSYRHYFEGRMEDGTKMMLLLYGDDLIFLDNVLGINDETLPGRTITVEVASHTTDEGETYNYIKNCTLSLDFMLEIHGLMHFNKIINTR